MIRSRKASDKMPTSIKSRRAAVRAAAQRALISALLARGRASSDDIRSAIRIPSDIHPSCIGAAVSALVRDRLIELDSVVTTTRRVAHSRLLRVWRLVDRHAATAWIKAHQANPGRKAGG